MNMKKIQIKQNIGMSGRMKLEVQNAKTGEITKKTDWFNNLILDSGLNMKGDTGPASACHVGSGTTPPTESDTALENFIASTNNTIGPGVTPRAIDAGVQIEEFPYYGWATQGYTFSAGAAEGNISEVGITNNDFLSSSGPLFSRALVLDENGNPTTIEILSDEILRVFYELRLYMPMADNIYDIELDGTTYTLTTRPSNIGASQASTNNQHMWGSGTIVSQGAAINTTTITTRHVGVSQSQDIPYLGNITGTQRSSMTSDPYDDESIERTATAIWNINAANFENGIGRLRFCSGVGQYQTRFDPPIMKTEFDEFTVDMKVTWGRINIAPVISAADETLDADGSSTTTITVQIKDIFGEDITTGGHSVDITTTHGTLLGSVVDHGDGTYTQELEAGTDPVEEVVVNCEVNNEPGVNSAFIEFVDI
jgi:hypothetical protein